MENNDKFIRDTPHGKLMLTTKHKLGCDKCKWMDKGCFIVGDETHQCLDDDGYYYEKDETEEKTENG